VTLGVGDVGPPGDPAESSTLQTPPMIAMAATAIAKKCQRFHSRRLGVRVTGRV